MTEKSFAEQLKEKAEKMRESRESREKQQHKNNQKDQIEKPAKEDKQLSVKEIVQNLQKISKQEKQAKDIANAELKTKEQQNEESFLKEFVEEGVDKAKEDLTALVNFEGETQLQAVVSKVDEINQVVKTGLEKGENWDTVKQSMDEVSEKILNESITSKVFAKIKKIFETLLDSIEKVWNLCFPKKKTNNAVLYVGNVDNNEIKPDNMEELVAFMSSITQVAQREETHAGLGKRLARKFEEIGSDNKIFEKGSKENKEFMERMKNEVGRDVENYNEKITESLLSKMQGEIKKIEALSKDNPAKAKDEIKMS